jgi:hypothetical protein
MGQRTPNENYIDLLNPPTGLFLFATVPDFAIIDHGHRNSERLSACPSLLARLRSTLVTGASSSSRIVRHTLVLPDTTSTAGQASEKTKQDFLHQALRSEKGQNGPHRETTFAASRAMQRGARLVYPYPYSACIGLRPGTRSGSATGWNAPARHRD